MYENFALPRTHVRALRDIGIYLSASRVIIGNADSECSVAKVGRNEVNVSCKKLKFNHFANKT